VDDCQAMEWLVDVVKEANILVNSLQVLAISFISALRYLCKFDMTLLPFDACGR